MAVTYYDYRNNDSSPAVPTDYWAAFCHPSLATSCASPANWGGEVRLSVTSFDIEQAPAARGPFGFFLGDYEGLQSTGTKSFIAMFVTTNCNLNPSDPNGPPIGNTSLCGPAGSVCSNSLYAAWKSFWFRPTWTIGACG